MASCGSSNTSASKTDNPPQYIKLSEYSPNQSSENQPVLVELERTGAGNGIISIPILEVAVEGNDRTESQQKWYVWSDNIDSAKQVMSESISIYGLKSEVGINNNMRINNQRYGLTKAREEVFVKFESEKLNSSTPSEFVEISLMNFGKRAIASSGSQFSGQLPSGKHDYSGRAYVFEPYDLVSFRDIGDLKGVTTIPNEGTLVHLCEFNMIANFNTGTAMVSATSLSVSNEGIPTYQINGDDIKIDSSNGMISSSGIEYSIFRSSGINKTGIANLIGSFAGSQANGVHGMVYSNETSELTDFVGAFYGVR